MKRFLGLGLLVIGLFLVGWVYHFPILWSDQHGERSFYCEDYALALNGKVKLGASSATAWYPIHRIWIGGTGTTAGEGTVQCSVTVYTDTGKLCGYLCKHQGSATAPVLSVLMDATFDETVKYVEIKQVSNHAALYAWNGLIEDGNVRGTINEK